MFMFQNVILRVYLHKWMVSDPHGVAKNSGIKFARIHCFVVSEETLESSFSRTTNLLYV